MASMNCAVIGDIGVGKTSLLKTFADGDFPENYKPTLFEHFSGCFLLDDVDIIVNAIEASGNSIHDSLRMLSYEYADVVLICFSLESRGSLESVKFKWYPQVKQHCPHVPVVLVGTKSDVRKKQKPVKVPDSNQLFPFHAAVTTVQGAHASKVLGATGYFECSALLVSGVFELFEKVAEVALHRLKSLPEQSSCDL